MGGRRPTLGLYCELDPIAEILKNEYNEIIELFH